MKRFFISFLGALAGTWVALLLCGLLFVMVIGVMAVSSSMSTDSQGVEEHSVLKITLNGEITDRETPKDLMNEIYGKSAPTIALNTLIEAIKCAKEDDKIEGIYLDCQGSSCGIAQSQAVVRALNDFSAGGKWVMAYGDSYTQGDYIIASQADSLFVNPVGMIDVHGLSSTTMYFKNLLDKIGVKAQIVKVGTYKSAVEPFMLTDMSDANRTQVTAFLENIWCDLKGSVADGRNVDTAMVDNWANDYCFSKPVEYYVDNKIADGVKYRHEMETALAVASGLEEDDSPRFIEYDSYAKQKTADEKKVKGKKCVAVLYALGDITEDDSDGIASSRLVPEILDLADDEDVDALVMRVNSGGGSAFASEQIWEALEQFKKRTGKPFYVSMSDYAASGGYYISCGADKIYAESGTLTGSIGIFGIVPDAETLMSEKLGINTATVQTNEGNFPSFFSGMTTGQRAAMQAYVDRGYETFVKRCADGRSMSVDSIKAIAEGRVWDGRTAMKLGLVDAMGGLNAAITAIAQEIGAADNYYIKEYPKVKLKWWEEVMQISKSVETVKSNIVKETLGESAGYYFTLKSVHNLAPVQARMDYIYIR